MEKYRIFYFILNPLVLITNLQEITLSIWCFFFCVVYVFLLEQNKWKTVNVILALSISETIAAIVTPLFLKKLDD
jgi:Na+-driven multidrug efflux pump